MKMNSSKALCSLQIGSDSVVVIVDALYLLIPILEIEKRLPLPPECCREIDRQLQTAERLLVEFDAFTPN